jgi:hypothetical protein
VSEKSWGHSVDWSSEVGRLEQQLAQAKLRAEEEKKRAEEEEKKRSEEQIKWDVKICCLNNKWITDVESAKALTGKNWAVVQASWIAQGEIFETEPASLDQFRALDVHTTLESAMESAKRRIVYPENEKPSNVVLISHMMETDDYYNVSDNTVVAIMAFDVSG